MEDGITVNPSNEPSGDRQQPRTDDLFSKVAIAIETSFRIFAAGAAQHRAPDNHITAAIYRHAPAGIQSLLAEEGPPAGVDSDHLDVQAADALRREGTQVPGPKPEDAAVVSADPGEEALEGARIAGAIETRFGIAVDEMLDRYIHAAELDPLTDPVVAFGDAIARRAIGYLDDALPGVGIVPLQQWASPERGNQNFREFARLAGRSMFARADAARRAEMGWLPSSAPGKIPAAAILRGARLAGAIEEANHEALDLILMGSHQDHEKSDLPSAVATAAAEGGAGIEGGFGFIIPPMDYDAEEGLDQMPPQQDIEAEIAA